MEIADESGFNTATFGSDPALPQQDRPHILQLPWPRIFGDLYRAISPMTRAPAAGTRMTQAPRRCPSRAAAADQTW